MIEAGGSILTEISPSHLAFTALHMLEVDFLGSKKCISN